MLYSEQLHPGQLVNRDSSPTSVSSRAPSYTCQVWKTALQRHCFAILQFIRPQLCPQPPHHQHRFEPNHTWLWSCFLQSFSSQLQSLISPSCLHYSCLVLQYKACLPILPFKYCQFLTLIDSTVLCDISTFSVHPLVLTSLGKQLFSTLHGISHPRVQASRTLLISSCFVWPGMAKDIGLWSRGCIPCQQNKMQTHIKSYVPNIPVPGRCFAHVHIDLVLFLKPLARLTY